MLIPELMPAGPLQDFLYIVTEFASSGTLHSLISQAKGPLSEDVVWRLLIQVSIFEQVLSSKDRCL